MPAFDVATEHARSRARLAAAIRLEARRLWSLVDPDRISESWARLIAALLQWITGGQRAAAQTADRYVTRVLAEQGINPATEGRLAVDALVGVASDGRPLESLLAQPGITAKVVLSQGHTVERAMATGGALAELIAHTQVADAGRVADEVALVTRPQATGFVRMIVGDTCSRCIILAGRWYRYDAGFARHPMCDCIGIPAAENATDLRTDPKKIFESMTEAEQDKTFTRAGAQAIRDGADIAKVVNARRGMATAGETRTRVNEDGRVVNESIRRQVATRVFGRDVFATTEGARRRRIRLMPEQIYLDANGDRVEAIRLLRLHGYIR